MQVLIDFMVKNYLWFLIISLILVFALIGYLVDTSERSGKKDVKKETNDTLAEPEVVSATESPIKEEVKQPEEAEPEVLDDLE